METVIWLALVQAAFGAFDTLYFHEYKLRLPSTQTAALELRLHAIRDYFYSIIFLTFAWIEWRGWLVIPFLAIIAGEIFITLWDFIEEDKKRKLPPGERIMHTIMAIVYGAMLAYLLPVVIGWSELPAGIDMVDYGWMSWLLSAMALGVFGSGIRDMIASFRLPGKARQ